MNRALFLLVLSVVLVVVDIYTYGGLKIAISSLPVNVQRVIKVLFWSLSVITYLAFILFEPLSQNPATRKFLMIFATIGVANVIGKILFALWLVIDDIIRLLRWIATRSNEANTGSSEGHRISRLKFLTVAGAATAAVPLLTMGWGVVSGAHDYTVKKRTLRLKKLPKSFEGFKILQISDVHSGSFWSKEAVKKGIEMINAQNADIVLFTGDLVNNTSEELDDWMDVFGAIKAKQGVYSVLGNHDYGDYVAWPDEAAKKANLDRLKSMQKEMGWDLLLDENRIISNGQDEIALIGIENWGAKGRFPKYGDLSKAVQGIDHVPVKLLMSHDPSHWRAQVIPEFPQIDVTFSGHTHGMQFGIEVGSIKWSPVKYFYPEWADLYTEGDQMLYVNRGFGYIGYPGRFGILPEITVFDLQQA
jgi:predicted MPP superfamily phosphohydrolase